MRAWLHAEQSIRRAKSSVWTTTIIIDRHFIGESSFRKKLIFMNNLTAESIKTVMTIREITQRLNSKKIDEGERLQFVTILYASVAEMNMENAANTIITRWFAISSCSIIILKIENSAIIHDRLSSQCFVQAIDRRWKRFLYELGVSLRQRASRANERQQSLS